MDPDRLAQLEADLRNAPVNKCKEALDELAQCPADQAIPLLTRVAMEGDFLRRRFAVMGLGNHRTDESFAVLQALLEKEQDGNVLGEIADSLFGFGDRALHPKPSRAELYPCPPQLLNVQPAPANPQRHPHR